MTFTLLAFHVVIFLVVLPGGTCPSLVHDAGWAVKFTLVLAGFIGSFWLPISLFQGWAWFAQYASALFWIFLAICVPAGALTLNAWAMGAKLDEADERCRNIGLLLLSILCTGAAVTLLVYSYLLFWGGAPVIVDEATADEAASGEAKATLSMVGEVIEEPIETPTPNDCSLNHGLIIATTVMCGLVLVLGFADGASIFSNSIVSAWMASLLWTALATQEDP